MNVRVSFNEQTPSFNTHFGEQDQSFQLNLYSTRNIKKKIDIGFEEQEPMFSTQFQEQDKTFNAGINDVQIINRADNDYNKLYNKPSINGVTLAGDLTGDDLNLSASFPEQGSVGDILMKTSGAKDGVSWVTPASNAEQDNTRPITAAAVYTEIGNINALLATI